MTPLKRSAALLLMFLSAAPQAAEIRIEHADSALAADAWYLNARIHFALDDEVITALHAGLTLTINIDIVIKRQRRWLWDKTIKRTTLQFTLAHQPLAARYIITRPAAGQRAQFDTPDAALAWLGEINGYLLLGAKQLDPARQYRGRLRVRLAAADLPPPLQPLARLSIRSKPYHWAFQQAPGKSPVRQTSPNNPQYGKRR